MPRALLSKVIREVLHGFVEETGPAASDQGEWLTSVAFRARPSHLDASSFLADAPARHRGRAWLQTSRRCATSSAFLPTEEQAELAEMADEVGEPPEGVADQVEWGNTEGLPTVVEEQASDAYTLPDMADSDNGKFRPNLGCKCKDWRPAPSHPTIKMKTDWLEENEGIVDRIGRLKVHMEDTTADPPVVHWDAEYDMQRFRGGDEAESGSMILKESHPAIPGSGTQVQFMTFCPDDGASHSYSLKVTAIDKDGKEMDELKESEATFQATPAPDEEAEEEAAKDMMQA